MRISKTKKIGKSSKYGMKFKIVYTLILLTVLFSAVVANEDTKLTSEEVVSSVTGEMSKTYNLNEYLKTIEEHVEKTGVEGISIEEISKTLLSNGNVNYSNIVSKLIGVFAKEIMLTIRSSIIIFILVIIMAIITSMELDKQSDITKIAHMVCFLTLSTVTITNFIEIIGLFTGVIGTLTTVMQVVSPFLMAMLIATGAITSTGIVQPMLLFIASAIGFLINYVVIPFLSISVAFSVISSISENFRLEKLSKTFNSLSLWIVGIVLTLFLGVLALETTLTSSVDSLGVKTTQAAVSNFVPVVGKFFSDSFETVVGATKIIANVGGFIGILAMVIIAVIPIIKIGSVYLIYTLLAAMIEPIYSEDSIVKYISSFANVYKTLLGILVGVTILFIISTGIVLNLAGSIVK